jgi:hypothetical protein
MSCTEIAWFADKAGFMNEQSIITVLVETRLCCPMEMSLFQAVHKQAAWWVQLCVMRFFSLSLGPSL